MIFTVFFAYQSNTLLYSAGSFVCNSATCATVYSLLRLALDKDQAGLEGLDEYQVTVVGTSIHKAPKICGYSRSGYLVLYSCTAVSFTISAP